MAADPLLVRVLAQVLGQTSVGNRRYGVDRDAIAAELPSGDDAETRNAGLGRAVVRLADIAIDAGNRSRVDDPAVAVFGIPDAEFGETICAVIQPREMAALDAVQVRDFLARTLASYKLPGRIEFRSELPPEDSGKSFKRKLRDPYWEKAGRQI
jgi:acyl-CoA synthetase (AMP-forming)/AMP-acid ligase II